MSTLKSQKGSQVVATFDSKGSNQDKPLAFQYVSGFFICKTLVVFQKVGENYY